MLKRKREQYNLKLSMIQEDSKEDEPTQHFEAVEDVQEIPEEYQVELKEG